MHRGFQTESTHWRERVMRDEHGLLRFNAKLVALRQRDANLSYWPESRAGAKSDVGSWTARGPFGRGGRARALVIDPRDATHLWAAAGSGGLWESENAGTSWRPIDDQLGLPAGCLTIDPRNPNILYFGTGEYFHSGGPGAGVFVSRDGGSTWRQLPSTRKWLFVPALAVSPANSNILLAAVAGNQSSPGVYRSVNAGQTWTKVLTGARITPSRLAFQPGNGLRVLLAVHEGIYPSSESRIMFSDDGGATWTRSGGVGTTQFTKYEIAFARSHPQTAYAISSEGTYRSEDGGASFTHRQGRMIAGLASWTGMLWVSPTNPNLLFAGGVSLARSMDGGATWQLIRYYDEQARDLGHLDFQAAAEDPDFGKGGNRRLFVLNDGGIDVLDDVLAQPLNASHAKSLDSGMQTTEFYAVAGRAKDGLLLGGAQDRGVLSGHMGSDQSTINFGGDGTCVLIDPSDSHYQYACDPILQIARLQSGKFVGVSDDLPDYVQNTANFAAPVVLDPNAPWRMIAGGNSLWRSENVRTATSETGNRGVWAAIKQPLRQSSPYDDRGFISAVAIAPGDSNEIWVAHNNGQVYRTRDGLAAAPTWEAIDDNAGRNPLPNRWPTRIVIDTSNRNRVYITFGGFTADNVWRTDDGGATWRSISGNGRSALPEAPVWSLVQHPQRPRIFVAGTEVAAFVTRDGGETWSAIPAPFNAAIQDLSFLQGSTTLLAGTFGRGLWTLELGN